MAFRFVDHTADLAVEITGGSRDELFAEALCALTAALTDLAAVEERQARRFALRAAGVESLLVDWLSELLYVFEVEGLLFRRAAVELTESGGGIDLAARAWGEPLDPARHALRVLVKGITYHGLAVEQGKGGFAARVIFDI